MTKSSPPEKIQAGMGAVMVALGSLATVAPKQFGEHQHLTRMWALREAALGAILLATRKSPDTAKVLLPLAALAVGEVAVTVRAPELSAGQRIGSAATAAAFGALGVYVWRAGRH